MSVQSFDSLIIAYAAARETTIDETIKRADLLLNLCIAAGQDKSNRKAVRDAAKGDTAKVAAAFSAVDAAIDCANRGNRIVVLSIMLAGRISAVRISALTLTAPAATKSAAVNA